MTVHLYCMTVHLYCVTVHLYCVTVHLYCITVHLYCVTVHLYCTSVHWQTVCLYTNRLYTCTLTDCTSYFAVSQLPVVGFEHVRTLFDSTQSQESKYDIGLRNGTRQCALRPILRPPLYLWCLWSNLNMWHHFLHLQNLRNPNLRLPCATKRGNAHYDPF